MLRPAHAPHSLRRLPSRASPRELSRSGTNPFPGNTETPGTLQVPPVPRRPHRPHRQRGTRSSSALLLRRPGRAARRVCLGVCTHVHQSRPTATAPEMAAASCSSPWSLWPSRWHKGRGRRPSAPEAGCPCWAGRAGGAPVRAAGGFSLLRVWTGESRLRRQAGQPGSCAAPRPASVGCVLAGVSTALSSSLRPLCPPGTPATQELCRWHLLQAARGLWGQPRGGVSTSFPKATPPQVALSAACLLRASPCQGWSRRPEWS